MRRIAVLCGLNADVTVLMELVADVSALAVLCADDAGMWMDRSPPPDLWSPEADMDHLKWIAEDCLREGARIVWVCSKRSFVATYIAALFAALLLHTHAGPVGPSVLICFAVVAFSFVVQFWLVV